MSNVQQTNTDVGLLSRCRRGAKPFVAGGLIGVLGGLIGLGGAEFRLPVLVTLFGLQTLEAVILNKAMSLVVVTAAIASRTDAIPLATLRPHLDTAGNLLTGSLIGAWWAAGHALGLPRHRLDQIVLVLLSGLAVLLLSEAWLGFPPETAVVSPGIVRWVVGIAAGFGIGLVAALLGVAGGELLIPTIMLLYGLDIKLAGSVSLIVSLPTMLVGFARYSQSDAFTVLKRERPLVCWMAVGSIFGAGIGGLLIGAVPERWLLTLLAAILAISAAKAFLHWD